MVRLEKNSNCLKGCGQYSEGKDTIFYYADVRSFCCQLKNILGTCQQFIFKF